MNLIIKNGECGNYIKNIIDQLSLNFISFQIKKSSEMISIQANAIPLNILALPFFNCQFSWELKKELFTKTPLILLGKSVQFCTLFPSGMSKMNYYSLKNSL